MGFDLGEPNMLVRLFARATGAAILAIGTINLLSVGDPGSRALRAVMVGNIVVHAASLVADFSESYARNAALWGIVALHVIIIAAFGYCLAQWRSLTARG